MKQPILHIGQRAAQRPQFVFQDFASFLAPPELGVVLHQVVLIVSVLEREFLVHSDLFQATMDNITS